MGIDLKRIQHQVFFLVVLPACAIGLAWISNAIVAKLGLKDWTFLVESLGGLGAYGLLFLAFDHWLWRVALFRWVGVVFLPDLSGRWAGELRSSFDNHSVAHPIAVEIRQTFSAAHVCTYSVQSQSASITSAFVCEPNARYALHYEYQNIPMINAAPTMHIHYGTAALQQGADQSTLEGNYYNWGRDERGHIGTLKLTLTEKSLQYRL